MFRCSTKSSAVCAKHRSNLEVPSPTLLTVRQEFDTSPFELEREIALDLNLTGATRLHVIVGDPIAQVKSPAGMTRMFSERGHDGIVVPVQVDVADLADFLSVADRLKNLDSIVVTVPHKFSCCKHCATTTDRASFLGVVNNMRRNTDRTWHGDMIDGVGFVAGVRAKGFELKGCRALLVGAGGAGSAMALSLLDAGVRELAIHDADPVRRDSLIDRLKTVRNVPIVIGSADPTGFDFVANATPSGMKPGDAMPIDVTKLSPSTFVGCVVTVPAVPPLIEAARRLGCGTSTGTDMFQASLSMMVDFLLHADTRA